MSNNQFVIPAGILGIALILSAGVGAWAFFAVRSLDNTLSVTGSAKVAITADIAKWSVSVTRSAYESTLPSVTAQVQADAKQVVTFMKNAGIIEDKISVSPISSYAEYSQDANAPKRYTIRQDVRIESNDPNKVKQMSQDISSLTLKGLILEIGTPEYYVSTLPDIRVSLLGKAVEDARARAKSVADATGQKVGKLKSAASGVVQVLAPNSIDVSDYGSYDLSSINKEVMVTARAVFFVQ